VPDGSAFCCLVRLWLARDAVAVAGRLAGDEKASGGVAAIDGLMRFAWRDLDSLSCAEDVVLMLDFERELAFEDVEELARVDVMVARLGCAGRHALFDDAEVGCTDEVPAVAVAPGVVFGGGGVDYFGGHRFKVGNRRNKVKSTGGGWV